MVAKRRTIADATADAAHAWWIGARVGQAWAGKLPDLRTVIAQVTGQATRQTVAQQRSVIQMISERYNIPLRKAQKARKKKVA